MTIQADIPSLEPFSTGHEWLSQYVIGSFYFSQGDEFLQEHIDNFAIKTQPRLMEGLLRGVVDDPRYLVDEQEFLTRTISIISSIFNRGQHIGESDFAIRTAVEVRWSNLQKVLDEKDSLVSAKDLATRALLGMLSREEKLLFITTDKHSRSSPGSPRFGRSIVLEHLVDQRPTRHPVFDELFMTIRQDLINSTSDEYVIWFLQNIEKKVAELNGNDPRDIGVLLNI